jgi:hypothetical protein
MEASWMVSALVILDRCSRPPADLQIDTRNFQRAAALCQVGKASGNDAPSLTIQREMAKHFIDRSIHQTFTTYGTAQRPQAQSRFKAGNGNLPHTDGKVIADFMVMIVGIVNSRHQRKWLLM